MYHQNDIIQITTYRIESKLCRFLINRRYHRLVEYITVLGLQLFADGK